MTDVKDTLLSEEGQQHGFWVCMVLRYLFSQKEKDFMTLPYFYWASTLMS